MINTAVTTFLKISSRKQWLFYILALPLLLLTSLPAQAAVDYKFSHVGASFPTGCQYLDIISGTDYYECKEGLILADGDTIKIVSDVPVTIKVTGEFTSVGNNNINKAIELMPSANLTFNVSGLTKLGTNTTIIANVIGGNTVTLLGRDGTNTAIDSYINHCYYNNSVVVGNITTIASVINIGNNVIATGNMHTDSAAINIGYCSQLTGNIITSVAGVITVGDWSKVIGKISTNAGAVNIGANSHVIKSAVTGSGSISTGSGVVNIYAGGIVDGDINNHDTSVAGAVNLFAGAKVMGNILSGAGAITLDPGATVMGTITSGVGAISIKANAIVHGTISSGTGAITIGARATVDGSVCSKGKGAVSVEANATVGGNVGAEEGAVTIGANATVGGDVKTTYAGAVDIVAGAQVAGTATVEGGAGALTIGAGATVGQTALSGKNLCDDPPPLASPVVIKSRQWRQIFMRQYRELP